MLRMINKMVMTKKGWEPLVYPIKTSLLFTSIVKDRRHKIYSRTLFKFLINTIIIYRKQYLYIVLITLVNSK